MLSEGRLAQGIEAGLRNGEPGEDSVAAIAAAIAKAVVEELKEAVVTVTIEGGACVYAGVHPKLTSKGGLS